MKGAPSSRETEQDLKSPDSQKKAFSVTSRPPKLHSPSAISMESNMFSKTFSGSFRNNFNTKSSTPQAASSKDFFSKRFASPPGMTREQHRNRDTSRGTLTHERSPVREDSHSNSSISHRIKLLRSAVKGLIASSNKLLKCANSSAPGYLFIVELYKKDKRYVETVFKELVTFADLLLLH